jgi:hypothetical protein
VSPKRMRFVFCECTTDSLKVRLEVKIGSAEAPALPASIILATVYIQNAVVTAKLKSTNPHWVHDPLLYPCTYLSRANGSPRNFGDPTPLPMLINDNSTFEQPVSDE